MQSHQDGKGSVWRALTSRNLTVIGDYVVSHSISELHLFGKWQSSLTMLQLSFVLYFDSLHYTVLEN